MWRKRGLSLNHIAETLFASETFVKEAAFRSERKQNQSRKRSSKEKVKDTKDIRYTEKGWPLK